MIFSEQDSWQDLMDAYWLIEQPRTDYTVEEECEVFMAARNMTAATVADGFAMWFADMQTWDAQVRWVALSGLDVLTDEYRTLVLDNLIAFDPASAGVVYVHSHEDLTAAELTKLKASIFNTMPVMKRKIERGDVKSKVERRQEAGSG